MKTPVSLRPGDKGTRQLIAEYGDRLVSVRYRYDPETHMRYKTVELIVDARPYMPEKKDSYFSEVSVRIGFQEEFLRARVKARGGKWDSQNKVWKLRYKDALDLDLQSRILPEKNSF